MNNIERIVEIIKEHGVNAEITVKNDNGVESIGITMGEGKVRPTLYPNLDTNDLDKIANQLIEQYTQVTENNKHLRFDDVITHFTDFDFIKDGILPCVVREATDDLVQRDYLDLKVIYRYMLKEESASVKIKNDHLKMWGITEEELFNVAKENAIGSYYDKDMSEVIPVPSIGMRVIGFDQPGNNNYGASALLFPELFTKYANGTKIIPSSIHELIVVPDSNSETEMLTDMIRFVNSTDLAPEDILADHPYVYDNGEIKEE